MTHSTSIQPVTNQDGSSSSNDIFHPTYIVYEGDRPTRAVLFNYISDTSGASTASVRYFSASDISEQYNITWAGQTMGPSFASDGTLKGQQSTTNVTCTQDGGCTITVPAPSIAVVFFDTAALYVTGTAVGVNGTAGAGDVATATFGTTIIGTGSATFDPKVLETSNGKNPDTMGKTNKPGTSGGLASASGLGAVWTGALGLLITAFLLV
jgi:hypothetical protein